MSDPYNTDKDLVKYWQEKHNTEFERAKGYEMDLIYSNYRIRELQAEISALNAQVKQLEADIKYFINEGVQND